MVSATSFHDDDSTFRERYALVIVVVVGVVIALVGVRTGLSALLHVITQGLR